MTSFEHSFDGRFTVVLTVIGQFVHEGLVATGALPEPDTFSSEWEVFFAHLLAGTSLRARFSQVLEDPLMVRRLVDEALSAHVGTPPTMAEVGVAPGSWSQLSTVPSFALPEIEDDADGDEGSDGSS